MPSDFATQETPSAAARSGPDFVMVGPLRAGTTMLRLLMDNHPRIGGCGEFEESVSQAGDTGWPELAGYCRWLQQHRSFVQNAYCIDPTISDYPSLVQSLWLQKTRRFRGKPILGCTIHSRFDRVREIWPQAKFIFLVRDPRDVVTSCIGMGWTGEATRGVPYWLDPVRRWCRLRDSLGSQDYVEVRYEDLLRDPSAVLDRCCRLVGERFAPEMLEFHKNSSYEPINPALGEQWRRRVRARTAEIVDAACLELIQEFGYEPSVSAPRPARWTERARLAIVDRVMRYRFRVGRYGLGRSLAWSLLKSLRIDHPWRYRLRLSLNEIDRLHLK